MKQCFDHSSSSAEDDTGLLFQRGKDAADINLRTLKERAMPYSYVYLLTSTANPSRRYTGLTNNIRRRLAAHNEGRVLHTKKNRPWQAETAIAFRSRDKAAAFERYLKSHSGRAFAKKHF